MRVLCVHSVGRKSKYCSFRPFQPLQEDDGGFPYYIENTMDNTLLGYFFAGS